MMKIKIEQTFLKLKNLIKRKKNEIKLKEKIKINFEKCHNKIPIDYIYRWRYSPTFRMFYYEDNDILKIFKNNNDLDLKSIMNIHHFTTNDWKIWSTIVLEKKFDITDLPSHLLNYYNFLKNEKRFLCENRNVKEDEYINYNYNIFN